MTIAAGFRCKDGVVLCSDSQISRGDFGNKYESKLFTLNHLTDCYLVYAGFTQFVKELVPQLKEIASKHEGAALLRGISKCYKAFHRRYFTKGPRSEKSFADIVFSIRDGKEVSLHVGSGSHCYPEAEYASTGTGVPVAEPFFSAFYSRWLSVREVTHLSVYALKYIKGLAAGVGGNSHIVFIPDKSEPPIFPASGWQLTDEEVGEIEKEYEFLHEQTRKFLLAYPDMEGLDIAKDLQRIAVVLKRQRDKKSRSAARQRERWEQEEARRGDD